MADRTETLIAHERNEVLLHDLFRADQWPQFLTVVQGHLDVRRVLQVNITLPELSTFTPSPVAFETPEFGSCANRHSAGRSIWAMGKPNCLL
ncbi:MAG: hypothetical protein IPI72_02455 [Flavobacteriales bacterium]|nr:hypothetical protein [Flavobacteriales bacterium]